MGLEMQNIVVVNANKLTAEEIKKINKRNFCVLTWSKRYIEWLSNQDRLKVIRWKHARQLLFETRCNECANCLSVENLQADHILPKSKYPELATNINNLQILCWSCNFAKGTKSITYLGRYYE